MIRAAVVAAAFALVGFAPPAQAQPVSECRHIPPIHHRMYGGADAPRQGDGVENTIAGMRATYNDGVTWYETDLRQLTDGSGRPHRGRFVLFHDLTLDRTTNATGPIGSLTYRQLPRTTAGLPIPTLSDAFEFLANHKRTHLLVELKTRMELGEVVNLLERYGFDHTRRVMFDVFAAGSGERFHRVAESMADRLSPYAVTGVKRWDDATRPATWIRRFGSGVRLSLEQGIANRVRLVGAGVSTRVLKTTNGDPPRVEPEVLWRRAVVSGAFTHVLTERSRRYLAWCGRVSGRVDGGGPRP